MKRRGLSLTEVLVACALLCMVMFVAIDLFPASLKSMRTGQDMVTATNLAQQVLDGARYGRFDQIAVGTQTLSPLTVNGVVYQRQLTVTSRNASLKELVATITWPTKQSQGGAATTSLTLQTLLYNFTNP